MDAGTNVCTCMCAFNAHKQCRVISGSTSAEVY